MSSAPTAPDPSDPVSTDPPNAARSLRASLRADLVAALKARDDDSVVALRTVIAAIDNGEAIEDSGGGRTAASAHVAGARPGVRSTEATRRDLTPDELRRIVDHEVSDRRAEAGRYDELGQSTAADRLRRQAEVLAVWSERLRQA